MQAKELIQNKRDGLEHSPTELEFLLRGYLNGEIKDYQMAAWLMAVYFQGLSKKEVYEWTRLMQKSGRSLPRTDRESFWIDKHSTGGVGDKPSLIMVPLVSSVCRRVLGKNRVKIPMVSGRGLGHSGGTLDKLESVPGFSPSISIEKAMELLSTNGFFMMGQTEDLVPADRRLYALRDVTGTVESIPLIVSSIMSKKLSESLDGLVLDVKTGTGAFMRSDTDAKVLAKLLIEVARDAGVDAVALLTRMSEPLGRTVGHTLEVEECAEFLKGSYQDEGLKEVVLALSSWMVHVGSRRSISVAQAKAECEKELASGSLFEIYQLMFEAQGGDWQRFVDRSKSLREQMKTYPVRAVEKGYLDEIKAREIGVLVNAIGGGRDRKEEPIDLDVGMEFFKKVGDSVGEGESIANIYYRKPEHVETIEKLLEHAVTIVARPVSRLPWVMEALT